LRDLGATSPSAILLATCPRGSTVQYKFIKQDGSNNVTWEGGGNRTFSVPNAASAQAVGTWQ